jgi:hypothetical protein
MSLLDSLTTHLALHLGLGYENNLIIAPFISESFLIAKILLTALFVTIISYLCKESKVISSVILTSILLAYALVVLNNILVIFGIGDLGLTIPKIILLYVSNLIIGTFYHTRGDLSIIFTRD